MVRRLHLDPDHPKDRLIRQAADVLKEGGVIIYPTDTVYGLGCDIYNKSAIDRIYQIKGISKRQPLSFICPNLKEISKYAHVSNRAYKAMRRLLPGPYTFVLEATKFVPRKLLTTNKKTVGIRVPDHPICLRLLELFGNPIISTSVSDTDGRILTDPTEIEAIYGHKVDLILDVGILASEPSTVIDYIEDEPEVLRAGKGEISYFM
ncbi:MAG: threonylcarbamoyl-AMP synthase [Calditrichaeota bacterium]|nr:threonylcarbamoyl-AMP synthase [Calditrichota bacterium]